MSYCPDCGCKMYGGICTNCHEEIIIEQECMEFGIPMSDEFCARLSEVKEKQKEYAKREDVKQLINKK